MAQVIAILGQGKQQFGPCREDDEGDAIAAVLFEGVGQVSQRADRQLAAAGLLGAHAAAQVEHEDDIAALDEYDRAFVASHRWAFDSAERVQIVVFTRDGVQASTEVALATPSALVAMKLSAIPRRKLANPAKRASDLYDIYQLIQVFNRRGDLAAGLGRAPHDLGPWCRDQLDGLLVDQAERSSLWLATEGSPTMQAVSAEDLRAVGEVIVGDMSRAVDDPDS